MAVTQKRRLSLPWIVASVLLGVALWFLLVNVVFVVREVRVVGAADIPETEVVRLSGIRYGARMNAVDSERVRLDVESDGRLAFVSLVRQFPNRMVLTVRPRTRDIVILLGGKVLLLDTDCYVVQITDRLSDGNLLYVTGMKASSSTLGRQLDPADGRVACVKAVSEALKNQGGIHYVSELNVSDTENLRILTHAGMTVLLGDSSNMEAKIAWMVGTLADLESRGEITGQLDVSSGTKADYMPAIGVQSSEQVPSTDASSADAGG